MSGRRAKVLSDQQIEDLLVYTSTTRNPERNRVIVLLSIKAGLRADEIAKLTWDMVLDPTGEVGFQAPRINYGKDGLTPPMQAKTDCPS